MFKLINRKLSNQNLLHYCILSVLIYLIVFVKLSAFHIRWWDESMFAVNAYEMIENGKWFSLYFDGNPDLFNTKPPLTIWVQVLFIKLLGYNELAIRLPSALATALIVLTLFHFVSKNFNRNWAWISSLILLTSTGFIGFHTGRTGDSDALLTLFLFLANLEFLKFILNEQKKHLLWFFLFITLAFATKLYAALLFAPAYFILLLVFRKFKRFIFNVQFTVGILFFLFVSGFIIYFRELDSNGYIDIILGKDAGRIFSIVEGHSGSWSFYLESLSKERFSSWFIPLIAGAFLNIYNPHEQQKKIIFSSVGLIVVYLLIVSISTTKLEWYDMPLYPYMALVASYSIYLLYKKTQISLQKNTVLVSSSFLLLLFIFPYYLMFSKSQSNRIPDGQRFHEGKEMYLFSRIKSGENLDRLHVYHDDYGGSLLFYKYKLRENGQDIETTNQIDFQVDDKVLLNSSHVRKIETKYNFSVIDSTEFVKVVVINKKLE